MDVDAYLRKVDIDIAGKKSDIQIDEYNNKLYTEYRAKVTNLENLINLLETYKHDLATTDKVVSKEDAEHKKRLLNFLCAIIEENLRELFPDEDYQVNIEYDYKRNRHKADLTLIDSKGDVFSPNEEGRMFGQTISYSAVVSLLQCLNMDKIYLDEAFSAASNNNLAKTENYLNKLLERDTQIFCIEQREYGYVGLKRREIRLEKDPLTKSVRLVSVEDY